MTKGVAHWVKSSATDFTTQTIGAISHVWGRRKS